MLVRVELAGPRDAALDLVEHQHQIVFVGQIAQALHEGLAGGADPALALDRLDQEARGARPDQRARGFQIVELAIDEAGQQRLEALVHLLLIGGADGRHGAAVEGVGEGDQLGAVGIAILVLMIGARGLDRGLDRFGTRIGEEHGVGEGDIHQPLRQRLALRAAIEIGDMHQRLGLALDRADQAFMAVTEQIDRDPAGEVQITRAVLVDQMAVISAHRANAAAGIDGHQRRNRHGASGANDGSKGMWGRKHGWANANGGPVREPPFTCPSASIESRAPGQTVAVKPWRSNRGGAAHLIRWQERGLPPNTCRVGRPRDRTRNAGLRRCPKGPNARRR